MRLIDVDLLLEEINSFSMRITGPSNAMAIIIMEETKKSIAKMADEQPTAYNVDKVVERLESVSIPEDKVLYASPDEFGQFVKLKDAVEIVKSSGIE